MRTSHRVTLTAALGIAVLGLALVSASTSASSVADAAMRRDIDRVQALIEQAVDVSLPHGDGMSALHWAARHGDAEMAALLIEAGADTGARTRLAGHTPLHVASTVGAAAVVELLLEHRAEPDARTTTGATPLHFAAAAGNAKTIALLLDYKADVNAREPAWGQTPLMFAAAAGRAEAVRTLVDRGADLRVTAKVVDIVARSKADREDASKKPGIVEAERAAGRRKDTVSDAPTQDPQAESSGTGELVSSKTATAPKPLGHAERVGTYGGLTALLLAAREGHSETALVLIEEGADINQVSAGDKTSPLLLATVNGYFDLALSLLERGANPALASDAGATPLFTTLNTRWITKSRHPQPTNYQQQSVSYLELMEALLEAGADPTVRLVKPLWYTTFGADQLSVDRTGATPFWRAAYALDIDAMRLLLAHGADPSVATIRVPEREGLIDGVGETGDKTDHSGLPPVPFGAPAVHPIHAASGVGYGQGYAANAHRHLPNGWLPAVRFLVEELGADVNALDHNGYSAVHHAAARGDNDLILYLVSRGADVTGVSRKGQTTADMANGPYQRVRPSPETVALLERLGATNNHNCVSC